MSPQALPDDVLTTSQGAIKTKAREKTNTARKKWDQASIELHRATERRKVTEAPTGQESTFDRKGEEEAGTALEAAREEYARTVAELATIDPDDHMVESGYDDGLVSLRDTIVLIYRGRQLICTEMRTRPRRQGSHPCGQTLKPQLDKARTANRHIYLP